MDRSEVRDAPAIFQKGTSCPDEMTFDAAGAPFNPGNYYYVGGNPKFYSAVLIRYRAEDFHPIEYRQGATPGWPFDYSELEPWYGRAEALYRVRGQIGEDPTEPIHSSNIPPVPDEPAIAAVRERLARIGMHPFSLPLGVDIDRWIARGQTPWDAFPDIRAGKMDAETCGLEAALASSNVSLMAAARRSSWRRSFGQAHHRRHL
jgi:choline dehydrogenase-like flavoprotein